MMRHMVCLSISLLLLTTVGSASAKTLFFDDFEGNKLDKSKWQDAIWDGGKVEIEVKNSILTVKKVAGCRDGILSAVGFNADKQMITVVTTGVTGNTQFEHALHFGSDKVWESQVEYVYDAPGTSSYWFIGPGAGDVRRIDAPAKVQFTNGGVVVATKQGNEYQFYVGGKGANPLTEANVLDLQKLKKDFKLDYEAKIDAFKGEFKVNLYACAGAGNSWSLDAITVVDEEPQGVEPGGKLATTWGLIKSSAF
ncbi:hypothetical protein HYR99_41240 [Candidatus Poribacteria bacterium]|nr:hypothetical protein [Candidatus Poribacteria bacterium]